ncbi:MAG: aminoacyl-histidine dipeptidase [Bacteroides sp. SM23_62_1]|nr:MAG: aminoacyl-histidine dipeptidase [Bacteroides sp. SM23_62_1]
MEKLSMKVPGRLWEYFEEICRIPRLSKKEDKILQYLIDFALLKKLEYKQDSVGNLVIRKNATPGMENRKCVILQSHVDMVGEKEKNAHHNFEEDPIIPILKNGWVTARNTTLGADDGIGIAAQLVILENHQIEHGPVECLFTIDEESGMTGAKNLQKGFIEGKILLNLDSEDEGILFIGCAGGIDTLARFRLNLKKTKQGTQAYLIQIGGLKGGHSGDEIHKSPVNVIQLINRLLWNASREFDLLISYLNGGNLRNAIPRDAEALVVVPKSKKSEFESFFHIFASIIKKEVGRFEPDLYFYLMETEPPESVITTKLQYRLLNALYGCPHGVISWSMDIEDLVETSTNLASIKFLKEKEIQVTTSQRSSIDSAKKDISDKIASIFSLAGAKVEHTAGYPGWTPNPDSEILNITRDSYRKLFKKNPLVKAIHAGLECGLILQKYPDLDMISFGPTIKGAHTPHEKISIKSTQKFWKLLLEVLRNIPET